MAADGWKTIELIRGVGQAAQQTGELIQNKRAKKRALDIEEGQMANQTLKLQNEATERFNQVEGDAQLAEEVVQVSSGASQQERDAAARIQSMLNNPSPEVRQDGRKAYLELYKSKYIDPLQQQQDSLDKRLQGLYLQQQEAAESGDKALIQKTDKEVEQAMKAYQNYATLKNRYSADAMKDKKPDQIDMDVLELKMTQGYIPTQAEEEAFIRERYVGKVPGIIPGEMMDKFYRSSTDRVRAQYGYQKPKANNVRSGAVIPEVPNATQPLPSVDDQLKSIENLLQQAPKLPQ